MTRFIQRKYEAHMVVKQFEGGLVLPSVNVERHQTSGWAIQGTIVQGETMDWVESFEASHPLYGDIWGNFNSNVYAETEEAFQDFYTNHTPVPAEDVA